MKKLTGLFCAAAMAVFLGATPVVRAQDAGASTNSAPTAAKPRAKATKGVVATVDNDAKTITLKDNDKTFYVTSQTRFTKDGQPATLADITVGESVSVRAKNVDGKMQISSVTVGKKKKHNADAEAPAPAAPATPKASQ